MGLYTGVGGLKSGILRYTFSDKSDLYRYTALLFHTSTCLFLIIKVSLLSLINVFINFRQAHKKPLIPINHSIWPSWEVQLYNFKALQKLGVKRYENIHYFIYLLIYSDEEAWCSKSWCSDNQHLTVGLSPED